MGIGGPFMGRVGISDPNPQLLQAGKPTPPGGQGSPNSALSQLLMMLKTAGSGIDRNPFAPSFNNPYQPAGANPFLTGQFAPTTFDPFTSPNLSMGAAPFLRTDRENNLQRANIPRPGGLVSPFRRGPSGRQGLLRGGGRRGFRVR